MVAFLVRPAGSGGKVVLAGIFVAAASKNRQLALTAATVLGYLLASLLLLAPIYTFVMPIREEQGVGARTAYGHIMTMSGCIAWTLFAVPSFYDNIWTVVVNGSGILLQLGYVAFFLQYAAKEARQLHMYLLLGVLSVSVVLTALVVEMVMVRGVWSTMFIGVIASILTGLSYISVLVDVVEVLRSRRANSNLDPLVEVLLGLSNASVWTLCALLSSPVAYYSGIPCAVGAAFLFTQLVAYLLYRTEDATDEDDFSFELRALFRLQV